jgi:hypothetical protein
MWNIKWICSNKITKIPWNFKLKIWSKPVVLPPPWTTGFIFMKIIVIFHWVRTYNIMTPYEIKEIENNCNTFIGYYI